MSDGFRGLFDKGWADFSECGRYRYLLGRVWNTEGRLALFVGLNPSTADAQHDDATVRKWTGFAKRWGYGGFIVANVFPYRSTDPKKLALAPLENCHREINLRKISEVLEETSVDLAVACWGNTNKVPINMSWWFGDMAGWLRMNAVHFGYEVKCFGRNRDRSPTHPLMIGYDTQLQDY